LTEAACAGSITEEQHEKLNALLASNDDAKLFYVTYLRMHGALLWHCRDAGVQVPVLSAPLVASPVFSPTPTGSTVSFFYGALGCVSSGWPMAYLLATVILGIGLAIGAVTYVSQPMCVTAMARPAVERFPALMPTPKAATVGRITGIADCRPTDPKAAVTENAPVSLGQRYALASGLMEITYSTGAKVILQGPVKYEVESTNGGFLSLGKLTGSVATEAARGLTIRTPTATVTDLGTEFGVEVEASGATRSHVFKGEISVATGAAASQRKLVRLKVNESVFVDRSGNLSSRQGADADRFVRQLEFNPFPGVLTAEEGTEVYAETFNRDSKLFPADYPNWTFGQPEPGTSGEAAAATIVEGVLRLTRDAVTGAPAWHVDAATTTRKFSGRMIVSVDIGSDGRNFGYSHVAIRLGQVIVVFHPGFSSKDGAFLRGAFRVEGIMPGTDMGFTPDVDVLHHLFVYFDGKDAYQVCLVDGLHSRNVFRTAFTAPQNSGKAFSISVHRSGNDNTGMFDNLRVIQLPEIKQPATIHKDGGGVP
jgi:hypothetical protein